MTTRAPRLPTTRKARLLGALALALTAALAGCGDKKDSKTVYLQPGDIVIVP